MVKVVWFLRKAEHLSMEEFRRWWLEGHAPMITARQAFSLPSAPETRADVMAHVSAMSRLVMTEHTIHERLDAPPA
jgi:hypothetical protein